MKIASALVSLSKIAAAGSMFLLNSYLARTLDINEYGKYSVWIAYANFVGLTLICGLNVSHIYHYKSGRDHFLPIVKVYCGFLAVCYLASFVSSWVPLYVLSAALSIACISILNSDAQAKERHGVFSAQIFAQSLVVPLVLVVLSEAYSWKTGEAIIRIYSILLLTFLVVLLCVKAKYDEKRVPAKFERSFFAYGIKNFVINLLGQLLYSADILIVSFFLDKGAVALYSVSTLMAKSLWLVVDAIGLVVFPRLIARDSTAQLKIVNEAIGLAVGVCLIPAVIFFVAGPYILKVAFGEIYQSSFYSACILMVASFPLIIYKIGSRMAAAAQRWTEIYVSLISAVILNIVLCLVLTPLYGIEGTAFSSLAAYLLCGSYLARKLGILRSSRGLVR